MMFHAVHQRLGMQCHPCVRDATECLGISGGIHDDHIFDGAQLCVGNCCGGVHEGMTFISWAWLMFIAQYMIVKRIVQSPPFNLPSNAVITRYHRFSYNHDNLFSCSSLLAMRSDLISSSDPASAEFIARTYDEPRPFAMKMMWNPENKLHHVHVSLIQGASCVATTTSNLLCSVLLYFAPRFALPTKCWRLKPILFPTSGDPRGARFTRWLTSGLLPASWLRSLRSCLLANQ